jgi:sulfite exporter TauE/SafE/copper chaperone CopZ
MSRPSDEIKTFTVAIGGMHCANCELTIERRFRDVPGIVGVFASRDRGGTEIHYRGDLDIAALRKAVADDGYTVAESDCGPAKRRAGNTPRDYIQIAGIFLILAALVFELRQFDLLPRGLGVSDTMSYGLVFLIGLVASVSSCIAVTGGLLVAAAAKYNGATAARPGLQRLKPLIYFNAGRIVSYTLLGGAVGALGSALTLSSETNGVLTLAASAVMILLGLQMLKLLPSVALPGMPKFLGHRIHNLAARNARGGAFMLGAATFFLPCGFTQALQLYVLSQASILTGALTMLAFSLGTLPALLSLSAVSSFARGAFQRYVLKVAGVAVVVLGLMNIQYGMVLTGSGLASLPGAGGKMAAADKVEVKGGKQIAVMRIVGLDYVPNRFTVEQGVPVEWRIDASEAEACGRILLAPRLGIRTVLSSNSTSTVKFTPTETGDFAFNCGMGMMTPGSAITVVAPKNG